MSDDDPGCEDCGRPTEGYDCEMPNVDLCEQCQINRAEALECQCPGGEEIGPCHCPACLRGPVEKEYDPDVEYDRQRDEPRIYSDWENDR